MTNTSQAFTISNTKYKYQINHSKSQMHNTKYQIQALKYQIHTPRYKIHYLEITFCCRWSSSNVPMTKTSLPFTIANTKNKLPNTKYKIYHLGITFCCRLSSSKVPMTKMSLPFTISSWKVEPQVILISCLEIFLFQFWYSLVVFVRSPHEKEATSCFWNHILPATLKHLSLKFAGAVIIIINSFVLSQST